ncbi:MAG: hypothetical protein LAN71_02790 [Acidobacteriia bacterium]|nr:hypothetical protein [Terriglobia bacterium]
MAIQASGDFKGVSVTTEHVVILDSTRTHQKRIDVSAVDAAGLVRSVMLLRFDLAPRGTGRTVGQLHTDASFTPR